MSNTVPASPGPVSQALSNTVYGILRRRGIDSVNDLGLDDDVRYQVLGLDPFTVDGLAAVAAALDTTPSEIVAEAGVDSDDADIPLLTDEPGKVTKLTGPDSVQEALQARKRARVSLDNLAAELGIVQATDPWQPLPPADVLRGFDQTIPRDAETVTQDADAIRTAWRAGEQS